MEGEATYFSLCIEKYEINNVDMTVTSRLDTQAWKDLVTFLKLSAFSGA